MNLVFVPTTLKHLVPSLALSVLIGASALPSSTAHAYPVSLTPSINVQQNFQGLQVLGDNFPAGHTIGIHAYGVVYGQWYDQWQTTTSSYGVCGALDFGRCPAAGSYSSRVLLASGCFSPPYDLHVVAIDESVTLPGIQSDVVEVIQPRGNTC